MPIRTAPFARARAMMAAITTAFTLFPEDIARRQAELAKIGGYESHGKGRGGYQASKRCVAQDRRGARKARNRIRNRNRKAHR